MRKWHEGLAANLGLRAGGAALLVTAWLLAVRLHHIAHGTSAREVTSLMLLLSAIMFLCLSAGSACLRPISKPLGYSTKVEVAQLH
jgi:hypothetical protein